MAAASGKEGVKWDEQNIKETYHPADKDYGHMKIDEPDTPYAPPLEAHEVPDFDLDGGEGHALPSIDKDSVAANPNVVEEGEWAHGGREDMSLKERIEEHDKFAEKRKDHYDMKAAMMRARALMAEEDEEDADE
ncbi:uncharacterized protein MONBRDRAFT_36436 [Monosiga brevicollis MX1]|uniref:Protein phosphatase inhibitor 2 n=1 Tax=Monosiga brevicollis TaxID=81824 RepID=A9UUI1_MONBE|nr:uncharacterized protein MONBRDRAFT_36436 [Monosiga brevicollis MX1]EDQ90907.1 predicted protein [Monosiga brevicollis MX1]|eukprot:XP_001744204.1 hypothetical protein [Monosiga brevicollis MX1]